MSEQTRFYNMTRPPKHRTFNMLKQFVTEKAKDVSSVIKYYWYYILYKLNVLMRYSYRTDGERFIDLPPEIQFKTVEFGCIKALVHAQISEVSHIDTDYFYKRRKGVNTIYYVVKDECYKEYKMIGTLKNIHLVVGDKCYGVDHLPIFKVATLPPISPVNLAALSEEELNKPVEYHTTEYDINKVKGLKVAMMLHAENEDELLVRELAYNYDFIIEKFKDLKNFTLADLQL